MTNQFEIRNRGVNVEVGKPVPQYLGKNEALQLAAHLVASATNNPESDFIPLVREITSSSLREAFK